MALTDEGTGTTMLVQPSGFGGNNGFGDMGSGWWILLLFILMGGWGGNFGGGFGGIGGDFYPWMNQSNQISSGFQNQMLNDNITGIQNSINGISTQLCNNQMADLERSFGPEVHRGDRSLRGPRGHFRRTAGCDRRDTGADTGDPGQNVPAGDRRAQEPEPCAAEPGEHAGAGGFPGGADRAAGGGQHRTDAVPGEQDRAVSDPVLYRHQPDDSGGLTDGRGEE